MKAAILIAIISPSTQLLIFLAIHNRFIYFHPVHKMIQMDEGFELPVHFNGKELLFPGKLHIYSYTQKIEIDVNGTSVLYERDDAGGWRAIIDPSELEKSKSVNYHLLQAIANAIEAVLK